MGFRKSTCYNLINSICCALNSKPPVDSNTKLDHATCSARHFYASDSRNISTSNPQGENKNGKNERTVKGQVLSRRSVKLLSEESWLEEAEAPFPNLENPSYRERQYALSLMFSQHAVELFLQPVLHSHINVLCAAP